jgi:hypothetical protein
VEYCGGGGGGGRKSWCKWWVVGRKFEFTIRKGEKSRKQWACRVTHLASNARADAGLFLGVVSEIDAIDA